MTDGNDIEESPDSKLTFDLSRQFAKGEIDFKEYARRRPKYVGRSDVVTSLIRPVVLELLTAIGLRR